MVLVSIWFPYASTIFSIRYTTIFPNCEAWGLCLWIIGAWNKWNIKKVTETVTHPQHGIYHQKLKHNANFIILSPWKNEFLSIITDIGLCVREWIFILIAILRIGFISENNDMCLDNCYQAEEILLWKKT